MQFILSLSTLVRPMPVAIEYSNIQFFTITVSEAKCTSCEHRRFQEQIERLGMNATELGWMRTLLGGHS